MPKKLKKTSAADILGNKTSNKIQEATKCIICHTNIPKERLDILKSLKTPLTQYTCVTHSTTTKIKGIYLGEVGTSELMHCDKIYDDTVRSVFRKIEEPEEDDNQSENDV